MSASRMQEDDYVTLRKLEEAFDRKDLSEFISLLDGLEKRPSLLRVHAVCMLEHIGDERVVQWLCGVLNEDSSPLTRHEAAFTLGQLGYRSAVPALVEAMKGDPSPIVRHEAAVALSSVGDESALPELEKAMGDDDEDVSNSALIAFEYLSYLKQSRQAAPEAVKPRIRL